jgi:hypothetical protein
LNFYFVIQSAFKIIHMKSLIISHCTAALLFSLIVMPIYATVQQTYRTAANDPQTELARDIANNIRYTHTYHSPFLDSGINAQQSLGTFMQLYNPDGQLIYSGGTANGKALQIPKGVLMNAKQTMENAVTWQPVPNVRLAAVAEYTGNANNAFVVVARSLQEVEIRVANSVKMILLVWVTGIVIITVHWIIQRSIHKAMPKH